MLKGIEMHELITLGFAKKDKNERAPKLMQLLSHFNKVEDACLSLFGLLNELFIDWCLVPRAGP